jgi:hypothetical protein
MDDDRLKTYVPMWTTEKDRHGLLQVVPGDPGRWLVFDLTAMAPMTMDDDEDVVLAVIENMRLAGVRILTPEETNPK